MNRRLLIVFEGIDGSGKSTLLNLIAGITKPTSGEVQVNGRISALIELGAGFHPELTGRENVYLNGAILGFTTRDIRRRFDDIVGFGNPVLDVIAVGFMMLIIYSVIWGGLYRMVGLAIAAERRKAEEGG